jgi:cytochrome b561
MNKDKLFKILMRASFIIVVLTSIPLFIKYILGSSPSSRLIVDLHVWAGIIFIVVAIIRMIVLKCKEM